MSKDVLGPLMERVLLGYELGYRYWEIIEILNVGVVYGGSFLVDDVPRFHAIENFLGWSCRTNEERLVLYPGEYDREKLWHLFRFIDNLESRRFIF